MPAEADCREEFNPNISKWNLLFEVNKSHWMVVTAEEGVTVYPCYACRDMFSSKNSFMDHVNRISIAIRYNCLPCKSEFKFYNPCGLLLHVRNHFNGWSGHMNLEYITIETLPLGYAGFPPHPEIPLIYDYEEDSTNDGTINSKFYNPIRTQKGQQTLELVATILLFYQNTANNVTKLILRQVSTTMPRCIFVNTNVNIVTNVISSEALQTAIPIENVEVSADTPLENGYSNIIMDYIAKKDYNKCPECFLHQECTMATHFTHTDEPLDEKFQCAICSYISPTACSFNAHKRIHKALPPYVCPECGRDFETCRDLLEHLDDVCFHIAKQVRLRCPKKNCCKIFAQVATFNQHFTVHLQILEKCRLCNVYYFTRNEFDHHVKVEHPGNDETTTLQKYYRCSICRYNNFNCFDSKGHIQWHCEDKSLRMYVYICKFCRNFFRSAPTYATHLLRCPKRYSNADELIRTKRQMPVTHCPSCNYLIRMTIQLNSCPKCGHSRSNLLKNIEMNLLKCYLCDEEIIAGNYHHCKYMNANVSLTNADDLVKKIEEKNLENTSGQYISPTVIKKKRKRSSPQNKLKPVELDDEPPIPSTFNGVYACNVCGFENSDRDDFHRHIVEHRDISTEFQCMECGTLFVVKPSFQKHLLFYHQIIDVDAYIDDNDCVDKDAIVELTTVKEEPVRENQCKVCREQFNDELELKKHFRVHGMAFLLNNSK